MIQFWIALVTVLIPAISTVVVALISKNTNKKVEKIEEIKGSIITEIEKNRNETQKAINNHILENDKTYLTDFMSELENGEHKNDIQIRRAYEIKEEYNSLGGDSYVDDRWEELRTQKLI